ncbi:MAG: DUF4301 family protein [Deltaproteobacteria bacterium]|nr:DUF4301 family protein [Deltaproteobacteria bacterium]
MATPRNLAQEDQALEDHAQDDKAQLRAAGISHQEAQRQLRLLSSPPSPARLLRPCTAGDGILTLSPDLQAESLETFTVAQKKGRVTKFVPASGAASRMFGALLPYLESSESPRLEDSTLETLSASPEAISGDSEPLLQFFRELPRFAFFRPLRTALEERGIHPSVPSSAWPLLETLRTLFLPEGLGYAQLPKGLIPFHDYPEDPRTAFEEHLQEGAAYARDESGRCRLHFTVGATATSRFKDLEERVRKTLADTHLPQGSSPEFEIEYSIQSRATDTLALDGQGRPFRLPNGELLLRPGGHGSLLRNLQGIGGDLVFIKNIDNVAPDSARAATVRWKQILGGYLVSLQRKIFDCLERWETTPSAMEEGLELLVSHLGLNPKEIPVKEHRDRFCRSLLDRPLRVCGVVVNAGEPGGGPFWVSNGDGSSSKQIIEMAQVDTDADDQRKIVDAATHFNPVDLVCGLRNWRGEPFSLTEFSDPNTAFVAAKNHQGQPLTALEHPGLWNGAMAHWNTVFIEVPASTFTPVKTVFDLLRQEHQD